MQVAFHVRAAARCLTLTLLLASSAASSDDERAPLPRCGCAASFDCNDNGIEDAIDIANGSSSDADGNGVPDECEARGLADHRQRSSS
jgi:hypothetical protein